MVEGTARKWGQGLKFRIESGKDRPPGDCAKATMKLIARAGPEMNGEFFSASDVLSE